MHLLNATQLLRFGVLQDTVTLVVCPALIFLLSFSSNWFTKLQLPRDVMSSKEIRYALT